MVERQSCSPKANTVPLDTGKEARVFKHVRLHELAKSPQIGKKITALYFSSKEQLEMILKAYEGLYYQLFYVDSTDVRGFGVLSKQIFDEI